MFFSESFFQLLVWAAIGGIALSVVILVGLFIRDAKNKSIW